MCSFHRTSLKQMPQDIGMGAAKYTKHNLKIFQQLTEDIVTRILTLNTHFSTNMSPLTPTPYPSLHL